MYMYASFQSLGFGFGAPRQGVGLGGFCMCCVCCVSYRFYWGEFAKVTKSCLREMAPRSTSNRDQRYTGLFYLSRGVRVCVSKTILLISVYVTCQLSCGTCLDLIYLYSFASVLFCVKCALRISRLYRECLFSVCLNVFVLVFL